MSLLAITIAATFCGVCTARMAYQLPHEIESILSAPLSEEFSCEDRIYGYYADVANNCEVFHVCLPIQDVDGEVFEMAHFSFACGNNTIFSQDSLTCMHPYDALPCEESENFYELANSEFGVIRENYDNRIESVEYTDEEDA